jgi:two-component system LytT family sensor kinase
MKKSIEIAAHIFFWMVFTLFVFMLSKIYLQADPGAPFSQSLYYVVFLELVMVLIFFYITFLGLPWARKKKSRALILVIALTLLLLLFAFPASHIGPWEVMSSILPHCIVIFLAWIFRKFSDSLNLEKEKQALMLQNARSELALLKMQVSPHFLFNTLNNIDYLVTSDTAKASESIAKLGDILRYMIYDAEAEKIPLSREIKLIQDYIELIRLRTSGENFLNLSITGSTGHLQIAPMIFIPLIENAYKHSSVKEGADIIRIGLNMDKLSLRFEADNQYYNVDNRKQKQDGGLGLKIVKRRLELIYAGRHTFNISRNNNRYNVVITLELDEF